MPCRSDYLGATAFEQESQQVAKYICFVDSFFKGITPKWVIECAENCYGAPSGRMGGDSRLVPYLCKRLGELTEDQVNTIVYNARSATSRDLANWWENHQKADIARRRGEEEEAQQKAIAKRALAKLTKEEREALGL